MSDNDPEKAGEIFNPSALLRSMGKRGEGASLKEKDRVVGRGVKHPGGDVEIEFTASAAAPFPRLETYGEVRPRNLTGVVSAALAPGPIAEEFRMLAARVRVLDSEQRLRCFGLVSAIVGEGKSTVALGLAGALGREASRVLLIESDLRRSALDGYLGLPRLPGLSEWLAGNDAPIAVRRVLPAGFYLLSAGLGTKRSPDAHFAESLASPRMSTLVETARRTFDFVIVDCPPLVPVADAVVLQELLDGFLMVVRERRAPSETVLRSLDRLKPDHIRGVVLNDHHEMFPRYSRYAYDYYGER